MVKTEFSIPDGWELVEEEARFPKKGENYLDHVGCVYIAPSDYREEKYPIVRRSHPVFNQATITFLKPGWLAMEQDGTWFWYQSEPRVFGVFWSSGGEVMKLNGLNWPKPNVTDWKTSKMRVE
jgi:hypothetical protein